MAREPVLPAEGTSKEVYGTVTVEGDLPSVESLDGRSVQTVQDVDTRHLLEQLLVVATETRDLLRKR